MAQPKNRLYLRGKTYWYQRYIPKDLRRLLKKKYGTVTLIQRSLKTRDYDEAIIKAKAFDLQVEIEFKAAERQIRPKTIDTLYERELTKPEFKRRIIAEAILQIKNVGKSTTETIQNLNADDLIYNAIQNVRDDDQPVLPTQNLIDEIRPLLIKDLIRAFGSEMKVGTDPIRAMYLEKAAENFIRRESETPIEKHVTVKQAIHQFLEHYSKRQYAFALYILERTFGDRAIHGIKRTDIRTVEKILYGLPKNWSRAKEFKNKTPQQIADHVEEHNRKETQIAYQMLKHDSVQKYIGKWVTFFNFCVAEEMMDRNPSLNIKKKPVGSDKTNFGLDALISFFNDFNPFKENGWGWIPLISLYHGTRGNEVAGLKFRDVFRDDDGIWVIDLKETKTDSEYKKGRRFPIHPKLIDWGFTKWIDERRSDSNAMIFEGVYRTDQNNFYEGDVQHMMDKWLIEANIKDDRHTYHSFRHTFAFFARKSKMVADPDWKTIGGWSLGKDASTGYGDAIPPVDLLESLQHLEFGIENLINPDTNLETKE